MACVSIEAGFLNTPLNSKRQMAAQPIGDYEVWRTRAMEHIRESEDKGPEAGLIADAILKIIEGKAPRLRSIVGQQASQTARFRWLLPEAMFEQGTRSTFRLDKVKQRLTSQGDFENMKTTLLPDKPDSKSPAGADIRFLMDGPAGNMIHSTVPPHQTNRATVHATVSEFWFILEGRGEIWRDDGVDSSVTKLIPGTAIDIPVGTAFQYRNVSDQELKFICIAMPPWPGAAEAKYIDGIWEPTVSVAG